MSNRIEIELGSDGSLAMLHDDEIDLSELGTPTVCRASHVEFDNEKQCWQVRSAKTGTILHGGFKKRSDAIDWEKSYYSPLGRGWAELEVA